MKAYIFTGSRTLKKEEVDQILDTYSIEKLYHGDCPRGGDLYAKRYCKERDILCIPFPAEWNKYGDDAGPIRNERMVKVAKLRDPDCEGIAIWKDGSKGTGNCVGFLKRYKIPTEIYRIVSKQRMLEVM